MLRTSCFSIFLLFYSVTLWAQKASISGNLNRSTDDTIMVLLYPEYGYGNGYFGDPIDSLATTKDAFSLSAEPGKYVFAAFGPKHDSFITPIILEKPGAEENITINMAPLSLNEPVNSVKIIGEFCNWKAEDGIPMTQTGKQWMLPIDTLMEAGNIFQFVINDHFVTTAPDLPSLFSSFEGNFSNIFQGQPIVFNPDAFAQGSDKSSAVWPPLSLNQEYKDLADSFVALQPLKRKLMQQSYKGEVNDDELNVYLKRFQQIEHIYAPEFGQLLLEEQMNNIHLVFPEIREAFKLKNRNADSLTMKAHFESENYQQLIAQTLKFTEQLDPQSFLLKGDFAEYMASMDMALEYSSILREKYNLQPEHFYKYLVDLVNTSPNEKLSGNILFTLGYYYTFANKFDIAEALIVKLIDEYPDNPNVKAGYATQQLKGLKVRVGSKAPEFAVQTTEGDSLHLSNLAGKYVFIDFWGTWCGPCIQEIPNVKALSQAFSTDMLQVVGLAQDRPESLSAYVKKEELPYPNAIAVKAVEAYGITAFPTTFLISPDGKIIGKNIRGENLPKLIQDTIRNYEEKTSNGK